MTGRQFTRIARRDGRRRRKLTTPEYEPVAERAEFAVIGLGAAGAATLSFLACAGVSAVGIDRFAPPHAWGSSHGETRLLRVAHSEGPVYVPLARRAIRLWRGLEARRSAALFSQTGIVYSGPPESRFMADTAEAARQAHVELAPLSNAVRAAGTRWLATPPDWPQLLDREAGFLKAEDGIRAFLEDARAHGAAIHAHCRCLGFERAPDHIAVTTERGVMRAQRVIVTVGAWAHELLPALAAVTHIERRVLHWFADPAGLHREGAGFRPFAIETEAGELFYGFPANAAGEVKVGEHFTVELAASPDALERKISTADTAGIEAAVARFLPQLGAHARAAVCMYPMARDGHFIIDRHPADPRLIIGAGLCGHGFKFAPVIGEALACLALDRAPPIEMDFFSLRRFPEFC